MGERKMTISGFTKPWKVPLQELGALIRGFGFDGIELPVRPGYQVEPQNVARDLPAAVKLLREFGLQVYSIAGPTGEPTIATCAEVGIPLIRTMVPITADGYLATEDRTRREFDTLIPVLDAYKVRIGVQYHSGSCVCYAMGLLHLIKPYDPRHICAICDAAHLPAPRAAPRRVLDARSHRPRGLSLL